MGGFSLLSLSTGCLPFDVHHSDEVKCGRAVEEDPVDEFPASVPEFSETSYCFHPAEDLFDSFALLLTDFISRFQSRASVDSTGTRFVVLRHVRGHFHRAAPLDELGDVVASFRPYRGAGTLMVSLELKSRIHFMVSFDQQDRWTTQRFVLPAWRNT